MNLTAPITIFAKDVYSVSNTAVHGVGQTGHDKYGRKFRYAQAGATTLVPGTLVQNPAIVTNHLNCAVNTALATLGATSLLVVLGATAVNANYYAGGTIVVSNGAGLGYAYTVAGHPAGLSSGNVVFQIVGSESLQVAANSVTRVDLVANPHTGVVINPTTATGAPVGIAVAPITNGQFGWLQVGGQAAAIIQGTPAIGVELMPSASVAGSLAAAVQTAQAANTATTATAVARILETGVDGAAKMVMLNIE